MSLMRTGYLEVTCPIHYGQPRRIAWAGATSGRPTVRLDCGCSWVCSDDFWEAGTDGIEYGCPERMVERYGKTVGRELAGKVARMQEGYDCVDNVRVAEVGNVMEEARYRLAKEAGCCGFFDRVIKVHGREFCIGFNHGH